MKRRCLICRHLSEAWARAGKIYDVALAQMILQVIVFHSRTAGHEPGEGWVHVGSSEVGVRKQKQQQK